MRSKNRKPDLDTIRPLSTPNCPICGSPSRRHGFERSGLQRWRCMGPQPHTWPSTAGGRLEVLMGISDFQLLAGVLSRLRKSEFKILRAMAAAVYILMLATERTAVQGDHWLSIGRIHAIIKLLDSNSLLASRTWKLISMMDFNNCRGPEIKFRNAVVFDTRDYSSKTWETALYEFFLGRPKPPFSVVCRLGKMPRVRDLMVARGYNLAAIEIEGCQVLVALRDRLPAHELQDSIS